MKGFERNDLKATDRALNSPSIIHVWGSAADWKVGHEIKGWVVVYERNGQLDKVKCYDASLITPGKHADIEFYKNSRGERSIRKWRG